MASAVRFWAHLVVELLRHATALAHLRRKLAARAVAALLLQAVEHLVEGARQDRHLGLRAFVGDATTG
jgi:hypothetical protein